MCRCSIDSTPAPQIRHSRSGGAVGEVSESLAGGNGVEDGSEQMGTKEMRRVAGQASGVFLDGFGPQDRRVGVDPLAHVFPSEGGETGLWCLRMSALTARRSHCGASAGVRRHKVSDLEIVSGASRPAGGGDFSDQKSKCLQLQSVKTTDASCPTEGYIFNF